MYIHTCSRLAARFASWTTPSWTEAIQPLEPCSPFHRSKTSCPEWPIRSFLSFDGRPPEPALLPTVKRTHTPSGGYVSADLQHIQSELHLRDFLSVVPNLVCPPGHESRGGEADGARCLEAGVGWGATVSWGSSSIGAA